jgi:hypothetical protein
MSNNQRNVGIRQLIASARDENEIARLVKEGKAFTHASPKTRRQWEATADRRMRRLVDEAVISSSL